MNLPAGTHGFAASGAAPLVPGRCFAPPPQSGAGCPNTLGLPPFSHVQCSHPMNLPFRFLPHPCRLLSRLPLLAASCLAACSAAAGLTGEYFDNADFTTLRLTRVDATVDFDWGTSSPTNTIGADTFAVRWSGQVEVPLTTNFTFHVTADDGARLWVNDRLLCGRTITGTGAVEQRGTLALTAGQRCNLVLEHVENTGAANVRLEWSAPGRPREVIPATRLFPTPLAPERGSILAEYWTGLTGTNLAALTNLARFPAKPDGREFLLSFECLQRDWADSYGTRVTGWVVPPETGSYVFAVSADEVAELRLGTNSASTSARLIASVPAATGFREFTRFTNQTSALLPLVAGQKYFVELRHREGTGADHFSVAWQRPGTNQFQIIPAESLVPAGLDRTQPAQGAFLATLTASHPRVLASAQRFEWLKRTLASNSIPQLTSWWNTLRTSANAILTSPVSVYTPDNRGTILGISRTVVDRASKLGFAWRVTGDTNYAERAWAELQAAAAFPDWHPAHFLDTAEMTHAFAVGYDWLYDYWTPARRTVLTNAIVTKGLKPSLSIYTNYSSWAAASANNWNLVCNGGMTLGALALGDENPALTEFILSRATTSAGWVMRHYTTDQGGWYEGPGYWDYTTDYNMRLLAGLESALGSDFGLSATKAVWEAGTFPLHMLGPTAKSFNFADAGAGNMRGPQLFWLARRYLRPEFAWHERANASVEALDLLWFDARGSDPQTSGLAAANWFRGPTETTPYETADAVTLRTRFGDSDASFVGFKAGEIGASHGHLDAGSFVFDALGQRWAHDLGGDDYALPGYFGSARWTYYRLRAEGHNTLVINPGSGVDQVTGARPPILLFQDNPGSDSSTVTDLTSAYGVSRVWRGVSLFQNRRWLLVQDEITAAAPATVWWFMHLNTSTAPVIAPDQSSVMLTQGSARLWLKILSGGGGFTVSNAVPLPTSPNPTGQNTNGSYQKLAVRLTGVTNTTLAVLMVPLRSGENPPTSLPALLPLKQWGTNFSTPHVPPPLSTARVVPAWQNSPVEVDLRALVQDTNAAAGKLVFTVGPPTNGTVNLLADGHTARFLPAMNFIGSAGFAYTVTRPVVDPRAIAYFDFEPPESTADGGITDKSPAASDGALTTLGTGSATLTSDRPAALAGLSLQSLRLTERGETNAARLVGPASPADLDFNTRDWTFAGWFKRATTTNDDFIFYLGNSDGFGSPDEFHLHGASGGNNLRVVHYVANVTTDLDLTVSSVLPNTWYHAAVVFDATNGNQGSVKLYLNGALAGSDNSVALNLPSGSSAILGGHGSSTFATVRWFNGWLDDTAIFAAALTPAEISFLATHPAGEMSGVTETNFIQVIVNAVNHPPSLAAVSNRTLIAGQTLMLTNLATDADVPAAPLTFTLLSGPAGATLDPLTGTLTWRPVLADAGLTHEFRLTVADTGAVATLPPVADTFACADQSAAAFGFEPLLTTRLKTNAPPATSEAFLRFDLAALPQPPVTARLRLTPVAATNPGPHALAWVTNDTWSETGLTWSNRPTTSSSVGVFNPLAGVTAELGLTPPAQAEAAGDGQFSLRLAALLNSTNGLARFASRECGSNAWPQLILLFAPLSVTNSFLVTVLPPALPTLTGAGSVNGAFHLSVNGDVGPDYFLEASTNLTDWTLLLGTNPPTLPFDFTDPTATNHPARFYRVRLGP
jgi:hypothetical protein